MLSQLVGLYQWLVKKLNQILTIAIVAVLAFSGFEASAQKRHTVMFYNVENLFDTLNDPDINDEEFLPNAAKAWNTSKYTRKLQNIEQVLMGVATANRDFPAVIGLSEIENRNVLEDIIVQGKLINGKVFDQTQKGRPATFRLNELITGWITAMREMPAGSRWEVVIPYNLGYGSRPAGAIKAFSTLIFDITLLDVR